MVGRAFAAWRSQHAGDAQCAPVSPVDRCALTDEARRLLVSVAELHAMSGRAMVRTLSVARTIADMAESPEVQAGHVAEAMNFRVREGIGER